MKRGNLLWEGSRMMLAEHRQLLNSSNQLRRTDLEEKICSEQINYEEWQHIWESALINDSEICIQLRGVKREALVGKISNWNSEEGIICIIDSQEIENKVIISDITGLKIK